MENYRILMRYQDAHGNEKTKHIHVDANDFNDAYEKAKAQTVRAGRKILGGQQIGLTIPTKS